MPGELLVEQWARSYRASLSSHPAVSLPSPFLGGSAGKDVFWLPWTETYSESVGQSTVKAGQIFPLASSIGEKSLKRNLEKVEGEWL